MKRISPAGVAIAVGTVLCFIALFPVLSHADMESEINHLLRYIETSDCTFNRNGTIHDGKEAGEHIRKKYTYAKRWIKSTEDFIRHTATKSSISGKPYQATCEGVDMPTAKWLEEELLLFRSRKQ